MTAPLVMIPGMLCDDELFSDVEQSLRRPVHHVTVTQPSIEDMAQEVLDAAPDRFVLAGLSLGAIVGFEIARRAPDRLIGLCAMSTNAGAPTDAQRTTWQSLSHRVAAGGFASIITDDILPTMFASTRPGGAYSRRFMAMAHRIGPTLFQAQLAAQATRTDATDTLAHLRCPLLVLAARHDALCPISFHERITATAPQSVMHIVDNAGHLSTWEQPATVTSRIGDWITTLDTASPDTPQLV